MNFRTDLALEVKERLADNIKGVDVEEYQKGDTKITRMSVLDSDGEKAIGRPMGIYVTVEVPPLSDDSVASDVQIETIRDEIISLMPQKGTVLVVGLGNTDITPDALGPKTASGVLATRHISAEISRSAGLGDLRSVAVISPGVLGQTGIETGEIIRGMVDKTDPSCVIAIDALASANVSRIGCTVQITNTGINPGSGVGNNRLGITEKTVGVPVISIGVPTVVDAVTLANDLTGHECKQDVEPRGAHMIVTPHEIDLLISRAAKLISQSINYALQPHIDPDLMLELL